MSWDTEFSKDYEIPSLILWMVSNHIIDDVSWRHELTPSFMAEHDPDSEATRVRLWVDHPIKDLRKGDVRKRFGVTTGPPLSSWTFSFETDDLNNAVEVFLQKAARYIAPHHPWLYFLDFFPPHTGARRQDWRPRDPSGNLNPDIHELLQRWTKSVLEG